MPGRGWAWKGAVAAAPCLANFGCVWEQSPEITIIIVKYIECKIKS